MITNIKLPQTNSHPYLVLYLSAASTTSGGNAFPSPSVMAVWVLPTNAHITQLTVYVRYLYAMRMCKSA